ncbi:MAG: undecaprenyldiphospho-muramoylpentapeptide beta-N-acetylglucosaminyltransferase [Clostridiales bacterium]|jgi:UDP-N-acetylglucosamine--N-acetylmuramyl-(pentapeptide) pyrophosphoryl-undecaprenol N-acetylglucosamine transferase|nr:undecaprenyldiphospho-muramoylpentapeptide beta-N-acetylglucosaminyltransferase [Clostridiales bacterium]
MKKILMTGGGTAGHVTPNIALMDKLKGDFIIEYAGSKEGIEKKLIENIHIPYHKISSGKLRRYFDLKNFTDLFRIAKGLGDANSVIQKFKPDVIFSKGGFVTVPIVMAGAFNKVPVIIHESDITCGLANKLSMPFAKYVCCSFPETLTALPKNKAHLTGTPIRPGLFLGDAERGKKFLGFSGNKPVLLIMGGSLGSVKINNIVGQALSTLLGGYDIIHLCGKGNLSQQNYRNYVQFEYVSKNLEDLFAASDIIVSRAGANSISEFLALKKPSLLIPLSKKASRGDQILNAESFQKQGFSMLLYEESLTSDSLIKNINELYNGRHTYIKNMSGSNLSNGVDEVCKVIYKTVGK